MLVPGWETWGPGLRGEEGRGTSTKHLIPARQDQDSALSRLSPTMVGARRMVERCCTTQLRLQPQLPIVIRS